MMFYQSFFFKTPESLQPVDIEFTVGKILAVIHRKVSLATTHEGVISFVFVSNILCLLDEPF